jgi:hypothetical protein
MVGEAFLVCIHFDANFVHAMQVAEFVNGTLDVTGRRRRELRRRKSGGAPNELVKRSAFILDVFCGADGDLPVIRQSAGATGRVAMQNRRRQQCEDVRFARQHDSPLFRRFPNEHL